MTANAHLVTARRSSVAIALTPRVVLAFLVVTSFVGRLVLVLGRGVQVYLPDEYLYGQLARSLAEGHGPTVLGVSGSTPALLQPLLTAPTWLTGDPELAFRLTQGINSLAMASGAVVVYALARALSVGAWTSVAAAGVALASPDLLYTGYVTADAIAYPLALLAILAAVRALDRPTLRSQALFLGAAALASFARLQYVALFVAAALGAIVVERGRPHSVARRHALLVGAPVVCVVGALLLGGVGRYGTLTSLSISAATIRWVPVSALLLAVATGVIIVPGALAWGAAQLVRPTSRARIAYAALTATLLGALLVASALIATETTSDRFFERYLMLGIPLAAIAFCCWTDEGRPYRNLALAVAAVIVVAVARAPISEYVVGEGRIDSPLLLATGRLEAALGTENTSLVFALAATACAAVAVAAAFGRLGTRSVLLATAAVLAVVSLGAHAADRQGSAGVVRTKLGGAPNWVDRAGGDDVLLVESSREFPAVAMLLALRNISVTGIALLGTETATFDGAVQRFSTDDRGVLGLAGTGVRRQLLVDATSTRIVFADARTVAHRGTFVLVAPTGGARAAVTMGGLYWDGWLSGRGSVTLYATGHPGVCRHASLLLSMPKGASRVALTFAGGARQRVVHVVPGKPARITIEGSSLRRTTVTFTGDPVRFLDTPGIRAVSARAVLTTGTGSCASPGV